MKRNLQIGLLLLGVIVLSVVKQATAQVTVTNTNVANTLAQKLIGPGIDIFNTTVLCNPNQAGIFVSPSSLLGMDSGIVLTTGLAASNNPFVGVNGNQISFANQNQGTTGDPDLNALAGLNTYDRCILEFDFKGDGDTVFFEYKFGSEEYPNFNCSNYNDVFGFFISGPGITGSQNLALIPNTNIPVAINSVNNGVVVAGGNLSNCTAMGPGSPFTSYYVSNTGGTDLTYDGFTVTFKAKSHIQSCSTYHIKLAIADGFDQIFDSGVFLKAGSFKSNTYHLTATSDSINANPPYVFEGCDSVILKIKRDNFQTSVLTDTVTLQITGTATNGVDYTLINSNYIFSSSLSDTVKTIYIDPFNDLLIEGNETLNVYLKNKCNSILDSFKIIIKDPPKFTLFNSDTAICNGSSVQINGVYDNGLVFTWSPTTGVSNPNIFNPILSPTTNTTYIVSGKYGNCDVIKDTIVVTVEPLPNINTTATNITCNGFGNGTITATGTGFSTPFTFTITPGGTILTGSPANFTNLGAGIYTITITSALGCTKTSTRTITEPSQLNWTNDSTVNIGCGGGNVGAIYTTASGGTGAITYTLTPGNIINSSGTYTSLAPGAYMVTAKDANNCSITTNLTITQANSLSWATNTITNIACYGLSTGSLFVNATAGSGIITYNLQPGNISNTNGAFSGMVAGTYTITATDVGGCTAITTMTITQPASPLNMTIVSLQNVTCNGAGNGSILVLATGGTGTKTYVLTPTNSTNTTGNYTAKPPGTYTVTVNDVNGCTQTLTATITQPPPIVINPNIIAPSCNPGNDGTLTLNSSGGTGTLTYKLNGGAFQSGNTWTGLGSGSYTVVVKDANNCTASQIVQIGIAGQPLLTNQTLPLTCTTTVTTINVTASNGSSPYTYTLMPNNLTNNTGQFPGVDTGLYVVTVVDANGCSNTITINLLLPPQLTWSNFLTTLIPCTGVGTGNVAAVAGGGVSPYTYLLTPPGTSNTTGIFPGLSANVYTVLATDAFGCTISSVVNMTVAPPLTLAPPSITNVQCFGTNSAYVNLNAVGGSLPISYTLYPNNISTTSAFFNNLGIGTYTVYAVDFFGCSNSQTFVINQPTVLNLASVTLTSPSCVPGFDGGITVNANGGSPGYTYSVDGTNFQTSATLSGLNPGTYTVTVKDANNCTKTSVVNLINTNAPTFSSVNVNQALCAGSNTGNIIVNINGGSNPITYVINPLGITNTSGVFNNLPVNLYTITVSDGNNCVITTTAVITQPSAMQWVSGTSSNVACGGTATGSITVSATGGLGTINYTRMPGNVTNTTGSFPNLTNATYTVTATDANNCTLTSIFNITQPSVLFFNNPSATNSPCFNQPLGTINAPANGGTGILGYTLNPGAVASTTGLYSGLLAGSYTVTVTDATGCTLTTAYTITQPASALTINTSNTIPTCIPGNDATITVSMGGGVPGYLYSINGNPNQTSNIFSGIGISNYSIVVTDAVGCTISTTLAVTNANAPAITSVNSTNILCYGNTNGSIITNVSGGFGTLNYTLQPSGLSNGNGVFNNLVANNYTVTVMDANNCSATSNVILTQPPILMWDSVDNRDVPCYGGGNGVVTSSASGGAGGLVYNLQPSNVSNFTGIFFGLGVGQYTLTATDANGCSVTAVFQINQPPPITWVNVSTTPASCQGNADGTISVTATGGNGQFDYKLLPNNIVNLTGNFTGLPIGTYTVITSDFLNCTLTTIVNIVPAPPVTLINAATTFASCAPGCDGTISISASGGNGNYTYSNNGGIFQASNQFNGLCTGTYTVTIKDGFNCTGTGTYTISTANGPNQINVSGTPTSCFGGSNGTLSISTSGGTGIVTYVLNPGNLSNTSGNFTGLSPISYSIVATDANGCSISTVTTVSQPTAVVLATPTTTPVVCPGGSTGTITSSASGGIGSFNYTLLPNNTTNSSGVFNGLPANTYTLIATDANGCSATASVTVSQPPAITFTLINSTNVLCNGGNTGTITIQATGGTGPMAYQAQPGSLNNTTGLFTGLTSTLYTVAAIDANNCIITTTLNITQPSPLVINNINSTIPTCVPGGDATMTISASGGTPNITYSLNGATPQSSNIFNNLSLGSYTVTVIDANNCSVTSITTITSPSSPTITNINTTPASCAPGCDGSLAITSSGGFGTHQYAINGGAYQLSNTFNNLCVNTYTVVVQDANSCTFSSVVSILQTPGPSQINATIVNVGCNGNSNGSINASAVGGSLPMTYTLMPGNISNSNGSFTGLGSGSYTVSVVDANGCTLSSIFTIAQPTSLVIDSTQLVPILCFNGNIGMVTTYTSGGSGNNSYTLLPPNVTNSSGIFAGLTAGVYTIQVIDANGCTNSTTITITQPPLLNFSSVVNTPVSCFGGSNGATLLTASGGSGTINYTLQPGNLSNTSGSFNNLISGNYTVNITDANGCSNVTTLTITQPTALVINSINSTIPSCIPGGDAVMTITASGGTGSIQFSLNGSAYQSGNSFSNLSLGSYTVMVKDANNCTTSSITLITSPASPIINSITSTNASCVPGCDGSLTITSSNGTGVHNYSINGGPYQLSNSFVSLCANTYTVTVQDAVGCTFSSVAPVNTHPIPQLNNTASVNVNCFGGNNGSITLTVTAVNLPLTYVLTPNNISNNSGSFNNLTAGTYSVVGTDIYGCSISTSVIITEPPILTFATVTSTPVLCFGNNNGIINCPTTGGAGGVIYNILPSGTFNPPNSFVGLFGNVTYTITAIDANNCSISTTVYVAEPGPVVFDSLTNNPVTCFGFSNAQIHSDGSGGTGNLNYTLLPNNLSNSTGQFNNLSGGNYTVVITDANGCSITSSTAIFEPTALVINTATANNISCFGLINGSISVSASGGMPALNYNLLPGSLNNNSGNFNSLSANVYTVTVSDINNCSISTTLTVIEPSQVLFTSAITNNVLCSGQANGIINSQAAGGTGTINYQLMPGNVTNTTGTFTGLAMNVYTITATDVNGCTSVTTVSVTQPPPLQLFLDSTDNITCHFGNDGYIGTHAIGGTPNYTYNLLPNNINNNIGNYTGLNAGNYTVIVTDNLGCKDTIPSIILTQPPLIVFTSVTHEDITCYQDSSGSITVTAAGGTGGLSFSLNPAIGNQVSSGNFQNLTSGTFTVIATDASNCTVTTTVTIIQNLEITAVVDYTEPVCHGEQNGSIEITATGGVPPLVYSFNGGTFSANNLFNNLGAGTYTIYIMDSKNCIADTILVLTEPEKVGGQFEITSTICKEGDDGRIEIVGTGGRGNYVYYLKPGFNVNSTGIFTNIETGTYTLTVKDSSLCKYDTIVEIKPPSNFLSIDFEKQDIGCFGYVDDGWARAMVTGGTPPYTYTWNSSPTQFTALAEKLRWGIYRVDVIDSNGCTLSDTVRINPGPCCDEVFIPNAFSPNNDQVNDEWHVVTAAGIELKQLDIYDRWGNRVWSTIDITKGWDGKYKGMPMDVETYFYLFRYRCLATDEQFTRKGDIILIR